MWSRVRKKKITYHNLKKKQTRKKASFDKLKFIHPCKLAVYRALRLLDVGFV